MRIFFVLILWLSSTMVLAAEFSLSIGSPNLRIGMNVSDYPDLVAIPGYPVYYAPRMNANYFFYDGLYWVYQDDSWYASSWYNGPWSFVDPYAVPVYVLRVPVRYYRQPPNYFRAWSQNSAPRWGDHWGGDWRERRQGWDKWNRGAAPKALPLPSYQRKYPGERYPDADHQRDLQRANYRYQPRSPVIAQHYKNEREQNDQWRDRNQQERERETRESNERRQQTQHEEQQQDAQKESSHSRDERSKNKRGQEDRDNNSR